MQPTFNVCQFSVCWISHYYLEETQLQIDQWSCIKRSQNNILYYLKYMNLLQILCLFLCQFWSIALAVKFIASEMHARNIKWSHLLIVWNVFSSPFRQSRATLINLSVCTSKVKMGAMNKLFWFRLLQCDFWQETIAQLVPNLCKEVIHCWTNYLGHRVNIVMGCNCWWVFRPFVQWKILSKPEFIWHWSQEACLNNLKLDLNGSSNKISC